MIQVTEWAFSAMRKFLIDYSNKSAIDELSNQLLSLMLRQVNEPFDQSD